MFLPIKTLTAFAGGLFALSALKTMLDGPVNLIMLCAIAPALYIGLDALFGGKVLENFLRRVFRVKD